MKKISSFIAKLLTFSLLCAALVPATAIVSKDAFAASVTTNYESNALTTTMCNAMKIVTGKAGKAFAAFAILSLGVGFFAGKVSWSLMIATALGISGIFGAPTVVAAITGESAEDCK